MILSHEVSKLGVYLCVILLDDCLNELGVVSHITFYYF